jgi:hypothetical protein
VKPEADRLWTGPAHEWRPVDRTFAALPQAPDNVAERKTLIYGPNGEPLIEQRPRPIGFRERS